MFRSVTTETATGLHAVSSELQALIAHWVAERRAPYGLADWFLEHDMPGPAAGALWCATQPDRPVFYFDGTGVLQDPCGPFPSTTPDYPDHRTRYYWCVYQCREAKHANVVPARLVVPGAEVVDCIGYTVAAAVLDLLDHWLVPTE